MGINPVNQPFVMYSRWLCASPWREPVIRVRAGELVLARPTAEQTTDEPDARRRARGSKGSSVPGPSARGDVMSLLVDSFGFPNGSGNSGKPPAFSSAKSTPARTSWRILRQLRRVLALADAEIVEAACIGQRESLAGSAQRRIHSVGFQHCRTDQCRVPVDVIHSRQRK